MAFLDETGAKLLAQKIIEKAGSGATAEKNFSNYTEEGANQYVTALKNSNGDYTGILYSWIPTIDNQPSGSECGLMSRTSYNLIGKSAISWNLIFYHESIEINSGVKVSGCPVDISFETGSSVDCSVRVYIQPLDTSGKGADYGKIIAEVCPYTKSKVTINYNNTVARATTVQSPHKAVAYVDYVAGAKMKINVQVDL